MPLRSAESFRLDAGEAGAEPTAPVFLNQGLLPPPPLPPLSVSVGESNSPGESNTTGTRANCSVGIRIWNEVRFVVTHRFVARSNSLFRLVFKIVFIPLATENLRR